MDFALRSAEQGRVPGSDATPPAAAALLRHFPAEVRAAYLQLRETGDPAAADTLVLAIVADHLPRKDAALTDQSALVADLGFESVTIAEMVFFIEDLLGVSVSNAEIQRVQTVGELRAFVRTKLAAMSGPAPGPPA